MSRVFLDTNLLIYLATGDTAKAEKIAQLISENETALISTQVLNEFTAACFKKKLLSHEQIQNYIEEYYLFFDVVDVDFKTISESFKIKKGLQYSWYDSLIIAAALLGKCTVLYSEDLHHDHKIVVGKKKLTIINPFL